MKHYLIRSKFTCMVMDFSFQPQFFLPWLLDLGANSRFIGHKPRAELRLLFHIILFSPFVFFWETNLTFTSPHLMFSNRSCRYGAKPVGFTIL